MNAHPLAALRRRAEAEGLVVSGAGDDVARDRAARVAWSAVTEPGDGIAGAVIRAWGPAEAFDRLLGGVTADGSAAASVGLSPRVLRDALDRWRPRLGDSLLADALRGAGPAEASLLTPEDEGWPTAVGDLGDHAPLCLWVRGRLPSPSVPGVAVVGARASTGYGDHVAGELSAGAVAAGVAVVSGAAYGIDGAAHRAALATGGATIAFLAGGCDRLYPRGHADLLERIVRDGAVVSEVPCGAAPTRWRFLARNRLIAAFSEATVVVEAGARSGSLNTAGHAAALGRPLGAVPGPVTSAASAGTHRLLREYDARCVTSAAEVLELIGLTEDAAEPAGARTDERVRILDALSRRVARDAASVAARAGLSVARTEAELGMLELEGRAERGDGGWRSVAT